jgi:hypothetical protein
MNPERGIPEDSPRGREECLARARAKYQIPSTKSQIGLGFENWNLGFPQRNGQPEMRQA